jgi:uncharacterized phage protein (TIGR01671 family)
MRNKYRAWSKIGNESYYFYLEDLIKSRGNRLDELYCDYEKYSEVDDKNNREIYEGDIVLINRNSRKEKEIVQFRDGCFYAGYHHGSSTKKSYKLLQSKLTEVIGNVHNNPELLLKMN